VRNPWDRLVSAWRFARQGQGQGETYRAGMWHPERYRGPEFATFEGFVEEWLARRDVRKLDGVFQPQSLFLCDKAGRLLVDHVGRLEDLAPTYAFVEAKVGAMPALGQANRSGDAIDYRKLYTPELAALVGRIYAEDVERFGYRF
jgi:hypothetical protein